MECWVLYKKDDSEKNKIYINMYYEQCRKRNIKMRLIIEERAVFAVTDGRLVLIYESERLDLPDFAVNRTRNFRIGKILENAGVMVFNNSFVTTVCNDKMLTLSAAAAMGISVCDTALNGKISDEPFIVKSLDGHGGNQVFLAEHETAFLKSKTEINGNFITQKIVSEKGKDLRVYVIGREIIAAMLRTNENDFRSNFSLGGYAQIYTLSAVEKEIVRKIVNFFDFGLVGIDFIFDNGKILLNEIEDVVGARMLYQNTDIDIVQLYFDFITEKMCLWKG